MKAGGSQNINLVIDLISSKWTVAVICTLGETTLRYSAIEKALPTTKEKVLVETLRRLERNGAVDRRVYPTVPPQVEYKLTSLGLDVLKLSNVLCDWADIHAEEIRRAQKSYDRRNKS